MICIRNITNGNIRIGIGKENNITLEPARVVLEIDTKTRNKTYRPGEDVAQVSEEKFADIGAGYRRSEGILFEVISEEAYHERLDELNAFHGSKEGQEQTIPGFLSRDHKMTLNTSEAKVEEALARIPINPETLELEFAGAAHGTTSRPDPAQGGKTLSEVRTEGVRRSTDAPAIPVDPSVLNKMGAGEGE